MAIESSYQRDIRVNPSRHFAEIISELKENKDYLDQLRKTEGVINDPDASTKDILRHTHDILLPHGRISLPQEYHKTGLIEKEEWQALISGAIDYINNNINHTGEQALQDLLFLEQEDSADEPIITELIEYGVNIDQLCKKILSGNDNKLIRQLIGSVHVLWIFPSQWQDKNLLVQSISDLSAQVDNTEYLTGPDGIDQQLLYLKIRNSIALACQTKDPDLIQHAKALYIKCIQQGFYDQAELELTSKYSLKIREQDVDDSSSLAELDSKRQDDHKNHEDLINVCKAVKQTQHKIIEFISSHFEATFISRDDIDFDIDDRQFSELMSSDFTSGSDLALTKKLTINKAGSRLLSSLVELYNVLEMFSQSVRLMIGKSHINYSVLPHLKVIYGHLNATALYGMLSNFSLNDFKDKVYGAYHHMISYIPSTHLLMSHFKEVKESLGYSFGSLFDTFGKKRGFNLAAFILKKLELNDKNLGEKQKKYFHVRLAIKFSEFEQENKLKSGTCLQYCQGINEYLLAGKQVERIKHIQNMYQGEDLNLLKLKISDIALTISKFDKLVKAEDIKGKSLQEIKDNLLTRFMKIGCEDYLNDIVYQSSVKFEQAIIIPGSSIEKSLLKHVKQDLLAVNNDYVMILNAKIDDFIGDKVKSPTSAAAISRRDKIREAQKIIDDLIESDCIAESTLNDVTRVQDTKDRVNDLKREEIHLHYNFVNNASKTLRESLSGYMRKIDSEYASATQARSYVSQVSAFFVAPRESIEDKKEQLESIQDFLHARSDALDKFSSEFTDIFSMLAQKLNADSADSEAILQEYANIGRDENIAMALARVSTELNLINECLGDVMNNENADLPLIKDFIVKNKLFRDILDKIHDTFKSMLTIGAPPAEVEKIDYATALKPDGLNNGKEHDVSVPVMAMR